MTVDIADFRLAHPGRERLASRTSIPRHRHRHGYITIVLSGGYQEAGPAGRVDLQAGQVAVHRSFDAHLDRVRPGGAELLNLPLPSMMGLPSFFKIDDPDLIVRLAERDAPSAALALAMTPRGHVATRDDWPDELASAIIATPRLALRPWAEAKGLAAETLSRGFRKAFGLTPARFRLELQAGRALELIEDNKLPLSGIAAECGFSDQPHLTRTIVEVTGRSPTCWRQASIPFKTGAAGRR